MTAANIARKIARKVVRWLSLSKTGRQDRNFKLDSTVRMPRAASAAASVQTLAGRLGFAPASKLIIVHADDLGLAQGVNSAFVSGLGTGLINSGSVMVPCRFFSDICLLAKTHSEMDIGLHLTLTSGRMAYRWAPVSLPTQVPSLVDRDGFFHEKWTREIQVNPLEVEIELRAQIEQAYAVGLHPTHLDSHQFLLQTQGRNLFEIYLLLGREYHLPVLIAREWLHRFPYLGESLTAHDAVVDQVVTINPKIAPDQWSAFYRGALAELPPGVTEFLIHPGYDNDELRTLFNGREAWGAAWRQRDFDFFTSDEFRNLLAEYGVKLTTWREIAAKMQH